MSKVCIYALRTIGSDKFYYVGSTKFPDLRLATHKLASQGSKALQKWLKKNHRSIEMAILRVDVEEVDRLVFEQEEFDRLTRDGHPLLNGRDPIKCSASSTTSPRGAPLLSEICEQLKRAVAMSDERSVAKAVECSRQALARALAGLPVYRGTASLVERYLEKK